MATTGRQRIVTIDPRFPVPLNVVDVRQENEENAYAVYDDQTEAVEIVLATTDSTVPLPPSTFTIFEQKLNMAEDGQTFVDVTFDFPDIPGIYTIDARYSPE